MQLLEFAQRFLNYKALVRIVNAQNTKVEYTGIFMDCPYRFCRFSDIVKCELETKYLVLYVKNNSTMYNNTETHFAD